MMHKVHGTYTRLTWKEQGDVVEKIANGLLKHGVAPGDKVAIMSQTRPHWAWADLSILSCGGVSIPIYPTLSPPEVQYLVKHSDSTVLFAESAAQARKILDVAEVPHLLRMIVIIEGPALESTSQIKCISWDDLLTEGIQYSQANPDELKTD